jgi:hypothetical protein
MKMLSSGRLQVVRYARQNCQSETIGHAPESQSTRHGV